ncbi:MFS transporter, partial [Streptomyces sp. ISL-11]|uniref:MFS transporter n=1 Tax=Streptomyces sp. ISL-11 TaxID=2819174 RepID=UPI001BEC727F
MDRRPRRPPERRAAAAALCLGLFTVGMDLTVLDVAAPALGHDLGAGLARIQWIVDAYAVVLGAAVLPAGVVTERVGRRGSFVTGLAVCVLTPALGALATTSPPLIAARCGAGAGAALLTSAALGLLDDLFPGLEPRRRVIGAGAAAGTLGALTGPAVGGWLVEEFSWRACLWVNVPLVAAALALTPFLASAPRTPPAPRPDAGGLALSAAGFLSLIWAVIEGPARGRADPAVLIAYGTAAALLAVLARRARRRRHPTLPPGTGVRTGVACLALLSLALFGALFVLS